MLKIGLIAHHQMGHVIMCSAYKVLYTLQDIKKHNSNPKNIPVQESQLEIAKMLEENKTLQLEIKKFRQKFGYVEDDNDRIAVYNHQYFDTDKYFDMQKKHGISPLMPSMAVEQYLMSLHNKYQMIFDGKIVAGEYMLPLFFAGILDTRFNWREWSNAPITYFYDNGLHIYIRYNNVKKHAIIKYVEKNWKKLSQEIKYLPDAGEYRTSKRDWQIYELRKQGRTYGKISETLFQGKEDGDDIIDEAAVKTAYQRVCKRIDSLFRLVDTTKKPSKKRTKKH